jgi:hypothetical protein
VVVTLSPQAQAHPAYLHALSDLRNARWNLERRGGDLQMKWDEHRALDAVDRAIADVKKAAIDDGKNLQDRPPVDAQEPRAGRLHKALAALQAAHADVTQEEDNAFANGLRARGIKNIDEAIRFTQQGIVEADRAPAPVAAAPVAGVAPAPVAQAHPSYLHALSDLRNARWNLERRGGDLQMKWDEHHAFDAIDRAINDIKKAAIDDGKNLQDHPPVDAQEPRAGRLHKALEALHAARADVSQEEDNAFASGLRARGLKNIDEAIRFTEQGIAEADRAPAPVAAAPVVAVAPAPPPAQAHPAYLHALSDLRNARWNLERRGGDPQMKWDEHRAFDSIDRAIADIKKAAIDDGKNLQDHPPIDLQEGRAGRLHKALAALQAARNDVNQEEDNAFASGLRGRGIKNVDEAIHFVEDGISEADRLMTTAAPAPAPAAAPPPTKVHPAYLHALTDLRNARANLERRGGDPTMKWDEHHAVEAIDRAIGDIKKAAIDDGKNVDDHPPIDAHEPRAGRLHRALSALQGARKDVSEEEDNAFASGLRARGLHDIDEAIRFVDEGISEAERKI